jgi:hypothetical protein
MDNDMDNDMDEVAQHIQFGSDLISSSSVISHHNEANPSYSPFQQNSYAAQQASLPGPGQPQSSEGGSGGHQLSSSNSNSDDQQCFIREEGDEGDEGGGRNLTTTASAASSQQHLQPRYEGQNNSPNGSGGGNGNENGNENGIINENQARDVDDGGRGGDVDNADGAQDAPAGKRHRSGSVDTER